MKLKTIVYSAAKMGGLFHLSSKMMDGCLPILCYHGYSFTDEHLFRPKLFMTADLFEQRMRWLKQAGYRTISLDDGFERLREGKLRPKEVVITIDDGFYSVSAIAAPILCEMGFTATIYQTTYYLVNTNPVFRICMQYLFWKTTHQDVVLNDLFPSLEARTETKSKEAANERWKLVRFGETQLDESGRMALAHELARRLEVDFDEILSSRRFNLMTKEELTALVRQGFDIELHTHRHRLPEDDDEIMRELRDNRAVLEPITMRPLNHFCYPSGKWSQARWSALAANGVKTATTCESGLNTLKTPPWPCRDFWISNQRPRSFLKLNSADFPIY